MNPSFVAQFEERGLNFVGTDVDGQRMEIIELQGSIYVISLKARLFCIALHTVNPRHFLFFLGGGLYTRRAFSRGTCQIT